MVATGLSQALPPKPNIPADAPKHQLLPVYQKQIRQRIAWWKQLFIIARTNQDILDARAGLVGDYNLYDSPRYQLDFSRQSVKQLRGLLEGKGFTAGDRLVPQKQLNLAIAFSNFSSRGVSPALSVMVRSDNEGMRYLGWVGYENICLELLKIGPKTAGRFLKAAGAAATAEANPLILRKILMVIKRAGEDKTIPSRTVRVVRGRVLATLTRAWPDWRRKVREGKYPAMTQTLALAVAVIADVAHLAEQTSQTKVSRTKVLQMVVNLAYDAASAYDHALQAVAQPAETTDTQARKRKGQAHRQLLRACEKLLSACEAALNKITGQSKTLLAQAQEDQSDRGAAVLGAVLDWAADLKARGVTDPSKKARGK
jgi:hypothetical protein